MFQALESVLDALRLVMLDFEIFGVACATGEADRCCGGGNPIGKFIVMNFSAVALAWCS